MNRMPAAVEMNAASGSSATLRAPTPDPEVPAKAQRRRFPAEYRLRILKPADAAGGRSAREAARGGESQTPAEAGSGRDDHHAPKKPSGSTGAALPAGPETLSAAIVAAPREEWPFAFW